MTSRKRLAFVFGAFALFAVAGLAVSWSAPYVKSDDEIVYLAGALEARDHSLPDARMLAAYDDRPYLYPELLLAGYEHIGYEAFKSIALVFLILATGLAAYAMFRLLGLAWMPALLAAVVALVPRYAGGLEVFGVFSFHEATGRQMALPLFFLATGFLIRRFAERKSLWPVFGIIGLCVFLHPVTVLLFAFISLIALLVARLVSRERVARVIGELLLCGGAFVLGGAYLFVKVFTRLAGSASGAVANAAYVHAVLFRDIWNFPAGVLQWYPHMAVVSAAFVAALGAFYFLPQGRALGARYPLPQAKLVLAWGLAIAVGSLAAAVVIPGVNLYAMEHWGAPYLFQQWSRVAKFYYLGLFVALVPAAYALARAYEASTYRWKRALLALAFVIGVASSSLGLEVTEFAVGYPNFEPSYIPQALSHVPDGVTSQDYGSVCDALRSLGAKPGDLILSGDFAFRFYCHAHLYATTEEGDAYIQLGRADTIAWYDRLMAERSALGGGDVTAAESFAKRVGASFIIVPHTTAYAAFSAAAATSTKQYIIVKVN